MTGISSRFALLVSNRISLKFSTGFVSPEKYCPGDCPKQNTKSPCIFSEFLAA